MATSDVDICNAALIKLGADTINALNENNVRARTMSARYADVRDAELRRRRWKFSIKRASLAALSAAPAADYDRQFQLPVDYLRLIEGGDIAETADLSDFRSGAGAALYSIEGKKLLTNLSAPLNIRYIAKITDVSLFDSAFGEALASRLAYECCEKITQSDSKRSLAMDDYRLALSEARRANAIERPSESPADDSWVAARING
jgi:hypothetical protein